MNEELQNALTEIITSAIETTAAAKEFVLAEMPDVIQQLLIWKQVDAVLGIILGLILISSPLIWARFHQFIWPREKAHYDRDWDAGHMVGKVGFGIIGGLAGTIFVGCSLSTILKIWIAPKLYLIEYARNLVQ